MTSLFIGKNVVELKSIDSTNNYSTELMKANKVYEGTIVIAEDQFSGRGQRGNSWETEAGKNLTFSIILYPTFLSIHERVYLTKITSLGVADYLGSIDQIKTSQVKIKWPNDIYVGDRKIAGMLIENSLGGSKISSSIIGIGLNINQTNFSSVNNPVSLSLLTKMEFDLKDCLQNLCSFIEARYLQLKNGNFKQIDSDYLSKLYRFGEMASYLFKGKKVSARITGVKADGKLLLELENQKEEADLKEIVFLN